MRTAKAGFPLLWSNTEALSDQFVTKYKEKFLHAISKTIGWLRRCSREEFNLLSAPGKLAASTPRQQQAEST
jgi:hypothetical protein